VLDSVNRRVVLLDSAGQFMSSVPVGLTEPRFLAVDDDLLYALDCDADRRLIALDWSGADRGGLPLPGLPDVVTGLFATSEGACVEVAHQTSYLLTPSSDGFRPSGMPVSALDGAPGNNGKGAGASIRALQGRPVDQDLGRLARVTLRPGQDPRIVTLRLDRSDLSVDATDDVRPSLAGGRAIEHLISVDGDTNDGLVIGARLREPERGVTGPAYIALTRVQAHTRGTSNAPAFGGARAEDSVLLLAESPFAYLGQPYVVAPDGRVLQPVGSEAGYSIYVHLFANEGPGSPAEEVQQ
jgi:hypothetical protein